MRFLAFTLIVVGLGLLIDYYVYRNWKPFAWRRVRWTIPVFATGMVGMAALLPAFALLSSLWSEPRLLRQVVFGLWGLWYIPKVPIALALLLKDAARGVIWLFGWFQARLGIERAEQEGPDLADLPRISRKEFLRQVGWTAAGVPFAVVGYGVFKGLYDFEVRHVRVPIEGLPRALDGVRIAQISDLHAGSLFSERPMHDVAALLMHQRPEVIALTGDFVNHDHRELPAILPALERLRAPLGVYAVRGNHDHYAHVGRVSELVRAAGVDLLVNDARSLAVDGARLHILGTDNTGFNQSFGDLARARSRVERNGEDAMILLAHDPTFWDQHVRPEAPEIDLTLSGHTHGGQIGFELGPLRWSVARVAYSRWAGLYTENGGPVTQHLYVNRGIGTVGPPMRVGVRPEVTVLELVRA